MTVTQFEQAIREGTSVFVFKKPFCAPCRQLEQFLPALKVKYAAIRFYDVDAALSPALAERLDVFGVPSLIAFHRGREIARYASRLPKPREEVERFLNRVVEIAGALDEVLQAPHTKFDE